MGMKTIRLSLTRVGIEALKRHTTFDEQNRCFSSRQDTSGTARQSFQPRAFGTAEPQRVTQRTHQRKTERNNRRLELRIVKALLQSVVKGRSCGGRYVEAFDVRYRATSDNLRVCGPNDHLGWVRGYYLMTTACSRGAPRTASLTNRATQGVEPRSSWH
jgi:hypothetical protein